MSIEPTNETKTVIHAVQQSTIDKLKEIQNQSHGKRGASKTDREFCRDLSMSDVQWSQVKSGKYHVQISQARWDKIMDNLAIDLSKMQRKMALALRAGPTHFVELKNFTAIFNAVDECLAKAANNPNRFIPYLAPTGGGKSCLALELASRFNAVVVQARKSWKSYYNAVKDIAIAFGLNRAKASWNVTDIEDLLIGELRRKNYTLVIDEGEYFSAEILDLFKLILNSTGTVIVCCVIPDSYDKWNAKHSHQADQIKRRTHVLIQLESIEPDVVEKFIKPLHIEGNPTHFATLLAKAANRFGAFDFIARVIDRLREETDITISQFEKAIAIEQANMGGVK